MLTSDTNPKIKYVRRLQRERRLRQREGVFVVEGSRWLNEMAQAGLAPVVVLATADWLDDPQNAPLLAALPQRPLTVTPELMQSISDTQNPAGVLAVLPQPALPWPVSPSLLLLLDAVRDPGNLGTLLRTAAAAGVDGVLLAPGCVDPFNPKVVRSSMGGILRLPILVAGWAELAARVAGTAVFVAAADGSARYTAVDWRQPATLVVGGEAEGAGGEARRLATETIAIPMHAATESLNAAVAGAIILFEAVRQRRGG